MELFEKIQNLIASTLKVAPDKVTRETSDKDLVAWDSLAHVNLMMSLEQTFDLFLEVEDFTQLTSVSAIVEYLRGQGKASLGTAMSLFDALARLALRYLRRDQFAALRQQYFTLRTRLHPLLRAGYGTFDSAGIKSHLEQRVGRDFEILMVHSSINHMKPMYDDDPVQFVQMLREFCGPDRTLAMPSISVIRILAARVPRSKRTRVSIFVAHHRRWD